MLRRGTIFTFGCNIFRLPSDVIIIYMASSDNIHYIYYFQHLKQTCSIHLHLKAGPLHIIIIIIALTTKINTKINWTINILVYYILFNQLIPWHTSLTRPLIWKWGRRARSIKFRSPELKSRKSLTPPLFLLLLLLLV